MEQMVGIVTVLMVALLAPSAQAVHDTGAGKVYRLEVEQDVWLEGTANRNSGPNGKWLIVAKHPEYPNKRSLVQFENLPSSCPYSKIQSAKMYLYYDYAHKAFGHTITQTPFIPRCLQLFLVKKSWKEAEATSIKRDYSSKWCTPYLRLYGCDTEVFPEPDTVMIFPLRPRNDFVEFDVTNAVKRWKYGLPNHGLLIRATNELAAGRDIRFASNAADSSKHAYILVLCSY
ncbi:hypothetical protein OS493_007814 [Desmophyllum pertusum]|uniref:Uncharacterized protein n=1 Tax=Desmophyllum pertusum TaxID=174260 RepID=A0A9W9YRY5_9CNID|nr:hypothetical protein OS493_007814 [Desmophyllum pertusum]